MYYKRQNKNQWSHSIIRVVVVVAVYASGTVDLVVRSAASTLDGVTEKEESGEVSDLGDWQMFGKLSSDLCRPPPHP